MGRLIPASGPRGCGSSELAGIDGDETGPSGRVGTIARLGPPQQANRLGPMTCHMARRLASSCVAYPSVDYPGGSVDLSKFVKRLRTSECWTPRCAEAFRIDRGVPRPGGLLAPPFGLTPLGLFRVRLGPGLLVLLRRMTTVRHGSALTARGDAKQLKATVAFGSSVSSASAHRETVGFGIPQEQASSRNERSAETTAAPRTPGKGHTKQHVADAPIRRARPK